ncbi:MAG: phosphatase PAP2 family protein [Clostridia bacterium]|nr:phosphatase PAP2 family protein [Clostridia bacterium]
MSKHKFNLIITASLFLTFIFFTVLVKTVDVGAIGPNGSEVGLSSINGYFFSQVGGSKTIYKLSEIFGYITFLVIAGFAGLGLYQLIKRKCICKVDISVLILGCFYVLVFAFYFLFEIVEINYRPILSEEGELEASYPSSHTLLSLCVVSSAIIVIKDLFFDKKPILIASYVGGGLLMAVTVIGRLLAGVHWLSDIVGGILLSTALIMAFCTALTFAKEKFSSKCNLTDK